MKAIPAACVAVFAGNEYLKRRWIIIILWLRLRSLEVSERAFIAQGTGATTSHYQWLEFLFFVWRWLVLDSLIKATSRLVALGQIILNMFIINRFSLIFCPMMSLFITIKTLNFILTATFVGNGSQSQFVLFRLTINWGSDSRSNLKGRF